MSSADADVMRSTVNTYYEAIDADDLETLFSLFHDDIVYERGGQAPIEGMAAFRRFYREERIIDRGEHTIRDVMIDGDVAAVRGHFSGVLKGGDTVEIEFADFHRFDGGVIIRRETYFQGREV